jgi:hypothetical protein
MDARQQTVIGNRGNVFSMGPYREIAAEEYIKCKYFVTYILATTADCGWQMADPSSRQRWRPTKIWGSTSRHTDLTDRQQKRDFEFEFEDFVDRTTPS